MAVVRLSRTASGVVVMAMHERDGKNAFTPELVRELTAAFASIADDGACKVVVITGYDTYFASGGTRESLLEMHAGRAAFTDTRLYRLPLDCPVPVVAAVQGHAIGGGFVFALFADVLVFSRESVFTTNFMDYGFTPGMGATCVVPDKLGAVLGAEMLLTGMRIRGSDLQQRGVGCAVLPRSEVLPHAMRLAESLADKPRAALVTLKERLTDAMRSRLPACVAAEQAMHLATMHVPEVRERILQRFGR